MFLDGFARFIFGADDDAAALPALLRHALRPRSIERVAGNPQTRPANLSLLNAFLLRDDPFCWTVINVGASGHAISEVKLADPFPIVAMPINQSRQDGLALGVDRLSLGRNSDFSSLADVLNSPILKDDHCVFNGVPAGAIDQGAADNGDRSSLRPNCWREEEAEERAQKNLSSEIRKNSIRHRALLLRQRLDLSRTHTPADIIRVKSSGT